MKLNRLSNEDEAKSPVDCLRHQVVRHRLYREEMRALRKATISFLLNRLVRMDGYQVFYILRKEEYEKRDGYDIRTR